jgi:hypothetical protein
MGACCRLIAIIFFLFNHDLFSQRLSLGVIGGIPMSDAFNVGGLPPCTVPSCTQHNYSSNRRPYIVGPRFEIRGLPFHFGIEVNALYRRLTYDTAYFAQEFVTSHATVLAITGFSYQLGRAFDRWEFPILGTYEPTTLIRKGKPYLLAGFNASRVEQKKVSGFYSSTPIFPSPGPTVTAAAKSDDPPKELVARSSKGVTVGIGFRWPIKALGVSPEFRYTRWMKRNFATGCPEVFSEPDHLCSNLNQFEIVVGISLSPDK